MKCLRGLGGLYGRIRCKNLTARGFDSPQPKIIFDDCQNVATITVYCGFCNKGIS